MPNPQPNIKALMKRAQQQTAANRYAFLQRTAAANILKQVSSK